MKKGVSPAVSYVLLMMVAVTVVVLTFLWGEYQITLLKESHIPKQMETNMMEIEEKIRTVSHGDTNFSTTLTINFDKGVMQVDASRDWVKYSGNLHSGYEGEITRSGLDYQCASNVTAIKDNETSIKMSRITETSVFRGASGSASGGAQLVEIVACFDNIDIVANSECQGRSGPRASVILRKTGFNDATDKPIVEVGIC